MYKNKEKSGRNNIAGLYIKYLRQSKQPKMSQRALADAMQLQGLDLDKNAIQRIESGDRFITDIELKAFSDFFKLPSQVFLESSESQGQCAREHPM